MESINPLDNPTLSLKRSYNKSIQIRLDEELHAELVLLVSEQRENYNSVSHFIRSAIIQKLRGEKNGTTKN